MAKILGNILTDTLKKIEPPELRAFVVSLIIVVVALTGFCVKLATKLDGVNAVHEAEYKVQVEDFKQRYRNEMLTTDSLKKQILVLEVRTVVDSIKANEKIINLNKALINNQNDLKKELK